METKKKINTRATTSEIINGDTWRPCIKPTFAAAGANDTGTWEDSPCRSNVAAKELRTYCAALRKEGIEYKRKTMNSSNVFMVKHFIVVSEDDLTKAKEIAKKMTESARLLYVA